MRLLRLRGRKICDKVLRDGRRWNGRHMTIRWLSGHPRHPSVKPEIPAVYVGTLASSKLDKSAVRRNRMRRRSREALRITLKELGDERPLSFVSCQLLVIPRSSSLTAPFAELQSDIRNFLSSRSHG